jgi:hypothetical protein
MKIKFHMPKFWQDVKLAGLAKELLTTIFATTISIILTFGTAYLIEQRQEKKSRKLMAMTIIQDIDMTLEAIRGRLDYEEQGFCIARYLTQNIERLDSIQGDTLQKFFYYVTGSGLNYEQEFSKSNEEIFNSSQESWKTLDDKLFIKEVQEFYERREQLDRKTKELVIFEHPVTRDELYQIMMVSGQLESRDSYVALCRQLLESDKVQKYIKGAYDRSSVYDKFLLDYSFMNETNKNLMFVSESDLYNFVHQTSNKTRRASEKQIIGTWVSLKTNDFQSIETEYRKDHKFTTRCKMRHYHEAFAGHMFIIYSVEGDWVLQKDSLIENINPNTLKVTLDENGAIYRPEAVGLIQAIKEHYETGDGKRAIYASIEREKRMARGTNIDPTGSRLDLIYPGGAITKWIRKEERKEE